jgi:hypothetical protein
MGAKYFIVFHLSPLYLALGLNLVFGNPSLKRCYCCEATSRAFRAKPYTMPYFERSTGIVMDHSNLFDIQGNATFNFITGGCSPRSIVAQLCSCVVQI